MNLSGEDLTRLSSLLEEALELSWDARQAWLESLSAPHDRFKALLRDLLARHDDAERPPLFDTMPKFASEGEGSDGPAASSEVAGATVGAYRLIREIGQGGMSVVWLATRTDEQIKRPVALKLPFAHVNRGKFAERFARERDILAGLTHPNIARLYDAGISPEGQPYLAMEYVEGTPLLQYCDQIQLGIHARLALFQQVLSAVQYAHSRLVIHRDLKPSNILVTAQDLVALLDFGIAKLLVDGSAQATELTLYGGRALTPGYASPEQIAGQTLGTSSDVYSLGVILYELLAGARPYRLKRDSRGALEEAILDSDPAAPSRTITAAAAATRSTSPKQLTRALRGDLDTIVLKSLAKRPDQRYLTADALAEELRRYFRGEPIHARASGRWYRARKFLARNAPAALLGGALLLALVGGLGAALWEAHTARTEARRTETVKRFLVGIFSQNDPQYARGKNTTAGEILEQGAARLDRELRGEPRILGELHDAIADIYSSLGDNVDALAHAERAITLFEQNGQRSSPEYLDALSQRAQALSEEEKWKESTDAYQALRRAARAAIGSESEWDVSALAGLAWAATEQGSLKEAQQLYDQALAIALRVHGERSNAYLKTLSSSVQALLDLGLLEEARAAVEKTISLGATVPGYSLTDRLVTQYDLASILFRLRQYQSSVDQLQRLVPEMERHIGPRHDRTIKARALLAQELAELGDFSRALAEERKNIDFATSSRAGDPELLALQELTFAKILRGADRFDEGTVYARRGLDYYDSKYPTATFLRERGRWILGDLLVASDHLGEGIETLQTALKNMQTLQGSEQTTAVADTFLSLGNAYRLKGNEAQATRHLDSACRIYDSLLGSDSQSALRCRLYQILATPPTATDSNPSQQHEAVTRLRGKLAALVSSRHPLLAELDMIESDYLTRTGQGERARGLRDGARRRYEESTGVAPQLPLRFLH